MPSPLVTTSIFVSGSARCLVEALGQVVHHFHLLVGKRGRGQHQRRQQGGGEFQELSSHYIFQWKCG